MTLLFVAGNNCLVHGKWDGQITLFNNQCDDNIIIWSITFCFFQWSTLSLITFINITINSNYTISVKFRWQFTFISAENDHDFFLYRRALWSYGGIYYFWFKLPLYNFSIVRVTVLMYALHFSWGFPDSASVWCEELCRSRRMSSTES